RLVIGAVLAGGAGSRLGAASKPGAPLAGRPLVSYPVAALAAVCSLLAVVCKASTALPALDDVERWDEPDSPRHPLTGIVYALERAGEPVLVCAADMPFVTADACRSLLTAPQKSVAVVAAAEDAPLTRTVEALDPTRVALPPQVVASVNTPEELAEAERLLVTSH